MTIRRTLLSVFLLIGLVPASLLAGLAFVKARQAVQNEINLSLVTQADSMTAELDKMLFERLENAVTWRSLEVMQDMQVGDVDKRLSNFLAQIRTGYAGIYRNLYVVDHQNLIIAASDPARIGRQLAPVASWRLLVFAGTKLSLERPRADRDGDAGLVIRTSIQSQFGDAELGQLVLDMDWKQIEAMLDRVAANGRSVAIVDADGRIVAASGDLRKAGVEHQARLEGWRLAEHPAGAFVTAGQPITSTRLLVGLAHGHRSLGLGCDVVVMQPEQEAFAPVQRMAWVFAALLAGLAIAIFWAATWLSGRLAQPIVALTRFALGYTRNQVQPVPPAATGEIGALRAAFLQMMADIEQSQSRLVRASKLAVVGEMSAAIAHEVRTPLGILRSSAQMLRRETNLSAEGQELMGFIESETERMNRLVSTILDGARQRPLNLIPHDMHVLLRQSRAMLAAQIDKHQIEVSEHFSTDEAVVSCDGEQITQVLLNLLLNAIQILPPGGRIELATSFAGNCFAIDIADDGPGIPEPERERIFEAFFCKREGGVGLGLAIVQQIVVQHGGSIAARESRWGGACFHIELPHTGVNRMNLHE